MNAAQKRWLLAAGLALTLAATGWVASQDEPKPSAAGERKVAGARRGERRPAPAAQTEAPTELQLEQLKRPEFSDKAGELFPSQTWDAPPPKVAPAPPEPPRAPPLPFAYFGRMADAGKAVVFLSRAGRDFAVRQGETIEGTYRVDEIRKDALLLTYLPLQQQQTLVIGSGK
jgi:hypothetical protein